MPVEIEDNGDTEATKQRESARRLIEAGEPLMVCKTGLLELEWVMRGYYGFDREDIRTVFEHVLSLPHVHIECQPEVEIGVPPRRINEIVHGKRAVTADTALRLSRYFGTSDGFWMGFQADYDLEEARERLGPRLEREVRTRAA